VPTHQRAFATTVLHSLGGLGDGLEDAALSGREHKFLDAVAPRFVKGGAEDAFDAAIIARDETGRNDVVLVLRRDATPSVTAFMAGPQSTTLRAKPCAAINALIGRASEALAAPEQAAKLSTAFVNAPEVDAAAFEAVSADRFGQGMSAGIRRTLESLAGGSLALSEADLRKRGLTGDALAVYAEKAMAVAQRRFIAEMDPAQGDLVRSLMEKADKVGAGNGFAAAIGVLNRTATTKTEVEASPAAPARRLLTVIEGNPLIGVSLMRPERAEMAAAVVGPVLAGDKPAGETSKALVASLIDSAAVPTLATSLRADGLDRRVAMASLVAGGLEDPVRVDHRLDIVNRYFKERPDAAAFDSLEMRVIDALDCRRMVDDASGHAFGDNGGLRFLPPSAREIDAYRDVSGRVGGDLQPGDLRTILLARVELQKAVDKLAREEIENTAVKTFVKTEVPLEQKRAWMAEVAAETASTILFGKAGDPPMDLRDTVRLATRLAYRGDKPLSSGSPGECFEALKDCLGRTFAERSLAVGDRKEAVKGWVGEAVKTVARARRTVANPRPLLAPHLRAVSDRSSRAA
jgi:hypothetical protein